MLAFRRWRSSHLLLAWAAYWLALVVATLGRAIVAAWQATQTPNGHGSIDAGLTDGDFHLTVVQDGVATWTGAATLGEIAFWLAVPLLLMWLVWLVSRPRRAARAMAAGAGPAALGTPVREPWPVFEGSGREPAADRADRADRADQR